MIVSKCVIVPPLKWEVNFERALRIIMTREEIQTEIIRILEESFEFENPGLEDNLRGSFWISPSAQHTPADTKIRNQPIVSLPSHLHRVPLFRVPLF
jgi:hypothetical protein